MDDQIEKWATKLKNDASQWKIDMLISKLAQAEDKSTSQFQKWRKRSFYQGPGVKFPVSWEKITLPPLAAMAFLHAQNYPPKI